MARIKVSPSKHGKGGYYATARRWLFGRVLFTTGPWTTADRARRFAEFRLRMMRSKRTW